MVRHLDVRQRRGPGSLDGWRPDVKKVVPAATDNQQVRRYLGENPENSMTSIHLTSIHLFLLSYFTTKCLRVLLSIYFFIELVKQSFVSFKLFCPNCGGSSLTGSADRPLQEDMESLTSQVGEEVSEVRPRSVPGAKYASASVSNQRIPGRGFKQAAFVAFLYLLLLK